MKKFKFVIMFIFTTILLTGCGKETLRCSKKENTDYGKTNEQQTFTFNNGKIESYEATMSIELNDDYDDYGEVLLGSLEEPFKDYKDDKGIEYEASIEDNIISLKFKGDYNKMDDDTKNGLGISEKTSLDSVKNSLEKEDYTCK